MFWIWRWSIVTIKYKAKIETLCWSKVVSILISSIKNLKKERLTEKQPKKNGVIKKTASWLITVMWIDYSSEFILVEIELPLRSKMEAPCVSQNDVCACVKLTTLSSIYRVYTLTHIHTAQPLNEEPFYSPTFCTQNRFKIVFISLSLVHFTVPSEVHTWLWFLCVERWEITKLISSMRVSHNSLEITQEDTSLIFHRLYTGGCGDVLSSSDYAGRTTLFGFHRSHRPLSGARRQRAQHT